MLCGHQEPVDLSPGCGLEHVDILTNLDDSCVEEHVVIRAEAEDVVEGVGASTVQGQRRVDSATKTPRPGRPTSTPCSRSVATARWIVDTETS